VDEALAQLPAVEAVKRRGKSKAEAKVSTTDPDARIMKMSDGGFRPAYNVQFTTDVAGQAIVGVDVTPVGTDHAALAPMLAQVRRPHGPATGAAVQAWRTRMATDEAKAIYKTRAATAERINADARTHRALTHIPVRGLPKIHTWVLWIALAHNAMRAMAIVPHVMT
jgi:hypothetical protein